MNSHYEPLTAQEQAEVDKVWEEMWEPLVMVDGQLDLDAIKRELFDFYHVIDNVGKVYVHITGGALSKPNYTPDVVTSLADEHYRKLYEEDND